MKNTAKLMYFYKIHQTKAIQATIQAMSITALFNSLFKNPTTPPKKDNFILPLPDDILRRIYDDHFHPKYKYNKIMEIVCDYEQCSSKAGFAKFQSYLEEMFLSKDVSLLLYFLKHGKEHKFNSCYNKTIILRKKEFTKIKNVYKEFALCWILSLYH
jgi:hypothetical protein